MIDINDRVELVKPIELRDAEGRKMAFYSKGETGTVTDTEIEEGIKGYYVEFDKGGDIILCAQGCLKRTDKPLVKFITQDFKEGYRVELLRPIRWEDEVGLKGVIPRGETGTVICKENNKIWVEFDSEEIGLCNPDCLIPTEKECSVKRKPMDLETRLLEMLRPRTFSIPAGKSLILNMMGK